MKCESEEEFQKLADKRVERTKVDVRDHKEQLAMKSKAKGSASDQQTPQPDARAAECANCGVRSNVSSGGKQFPKCSKCKSVYYCGADCQRAHWKQHKVRVTHYSSTHLRITHH